MRRLAAIVHDLDFKDDRFHAAESPVVEALISGLRLAHSDDAVLLGHGMTMFDPLYREFEQSMRPRGPRPVARKRTPFASPAQEGAHFDDCRSPLSKRQTEDM